MTMNREQKKASAGIDAKSSGADWWARFFALTGIIISIATLLYNIHKDHVALRENIEPELECHVSPMHGPPYDNLTFALRNASPISVASVTVEYHSFMLTAANLHLIAFGGVDTQYSSVPGFYWLTAQDLGPGALLEKHVDSSSILVNPNTLTAAVFEVSFYRPGDMRRFDKECMFFLGTDFVHTHADFRLRPGYMDALAQIRDAVAYKRQRRRQALEEDELRTNGHEEVRRQ